MRFKFIVVFLFIVSTLLAYDFSMINLINPSGLKAKEFEIMIRHRFYGDITDDPLNNFLGMDAGANVNLSARYQFYRKAEVKISYSRRKSEKIYGLAYRIDIEDFPVYGQFGIDYFSYEELSQPEPTRSNMFYYLSLQNEEILERFVTTLNTAYDGYNERFVLGLGFALELVDNISLLGEYYPVLDRDTADARLAQYIGAEDAYAFGIKLDTYAHQFIFLLSNSDDVGFRRVSFGVDKDSYLRLGFNIQRRLE
ncbi:MAG: DUF5777 family beta-barrel protein [Candidatus Stygibacter australis]|nr:DUF5777 family beta-barrel protein [Candidatus Stygibacter australis]MDP8322167.1 DUF5777 family beta-barrel protein [Candidatus Stygibacter australis]